MLALALRRAGGAGIWDATDARVNARAPPRPEKTP
jgi:hypothetical protein